MKTLTITLSDDAYRAASEEARQFNIDPGQLCSIRLIEQLKSRPNNHNSERPTPPKTSLSQEGHFDVAKEFLHFPRQSIAFAQRFVDEVLKFPNIKVGRHGNGIGFDPQFVWIEALLQQSGRSGIRVSFYGRPESFKNRPSVLQRGRGTAYSRAVIENEADLRAILPLIRQAWEKRFGR